MFTMPHLALPAQDTSCPNSMFYWKSISLGPEHLEMLFHGVFKHFSDDAPSCATVAVRAMIVIHACVCVKE